MRPTQVSHSGMPSGPTYMGWWGGFAGPKQKGITQYSLSPFQQNPVKNAVRDYIFFGYKRLMQQAPYFAIPFAIGYGIIAWGKKKNAYYNSKAGHLAGHGEH